jgi:hypothetical protein
MSFIVSFITNVSAGQIPWNLCQKTAIFKDFWEQKWLRENIMLYPSIFTAMPSPRAKSIIT